MNGLVSNVIIAPFLAVHYSDTDSGNSWDCCWSLGICLQKWSGIWSSYTTLLIPWYFASILIVLLLLFYWIQERFVEGRALDAIRQYAETPNDVTQVIDFMQNTVSW